MSPACPAPRWSTTAGAPRRHAGLVERCLLAGLLPPPVAGPAFHTVLAALLWQHHMPPTPSTRPRDGEGLGESLSTSCPVPCAAPQRVPGARHLGGVDGGSLRPHPPPGGLPRLCGLEDLRQAQQAQPRWVGGVAGSCCGCCCLQAVQQAQPRWAGSRFGHRGWLSDGGDSLQVVQQAQQQVSGNHVTTPAQHGRTRCISCADHRTLTPCLALPCPAPPLPSPADGPFWGGNAMWGALAATVASLVIGSILSYALVNVS